MCIYLPLQADLISAFPIEERKKYVLNKWEQSKAMFMILGSK